MATTHDLPIEERLYARVEALIARTGAIPTSLRAWHAAVFAKTLLACKDGKLSPATLPLQLLHQADERVVLEALCLACACFHTAADVMDDCEDDDLDPSVWGTNGRPHAINAASGIVFLLYQAIQEMPITETQQAAIIREFSASGWTMHIGQHDDLAATNTIAPANHRTISQRKSGAEVAAFLATAALSLGRDPSPYRHFGEALGTLVQAISDVADVWICDISPDLISGKQGLPIATALATDDIATRLAFAGDRRHVTNQRQLRRHLCSPPILQAWRTEISDCAEAMATALAMLPDEVGLRAVADRLIAQADDLATALEQAAPELHRASSRDSRPASIPAIEQAKAFVTDTPLYAESWERHRWGLFGKPLVIGDIFGPAVIAETLAGLGIDQPDIIRHLLKRQDSDGWRFYPGHEEIPCDCDDLGQMISLFLANGMAPDQVANVCAPALETALQACLPIGKLTVWHYSAVTRVERIGWAGQDCVGSLANGLRGIALLRLSAWQDILTGTVRHLLAAVGADGLWRGYFYPDHHLCTQLVVQGLLAQRASLSDDMQRQIDATLARTRAELLRTQRLDGGWGSAQATAAALVTLLQLDPPPASVQTGIRFLEETQQSDGGWAAEPYYMTPGPRDTFVPATSRTLTSSLCLRALSHAREAMLSPSPEPISLAAAHV